MNSEERKAQTNLVCFGIEVDAKSWILSLETAERFAYVLIIGLIFCPNGE